MVEKNWGDAIELVPEIRLARRISKKYGLKPGFDIQSFAEIFFTIQEISIPFNIDALFFGSEKDDGKAKIILNSDTFQRRRRFTLAHELGHHFIPWHAGLIVCHIDDGSHHNEFVYQHMESEANHFASELIMPSKWILNLIRRYEDISIIIEKIHDTGTSYTAANLAVCKLLPPGYIFVQINNYSDEIEYTGKSRGTIAQLPPRNSDFDPEYYSKIASKHDEIFNDLYSIHWFTFKQSKKIISEIDDKRDSKQIFKDLLTGLKFEQKKKQRLTQVINGVVGAANSMHKFQNKEDLYNFLFQRIGSKDEIKFLLDYKEFNLFLSIKSSEITKKYV